MYGTTIGRGRFAACTSSHFGCCCLWPSTLPVGHSRTGQGGKRSPSACDSMFANFDCGGSPVCDEKVHSLLDDRGGLETLTLEHGESVGRGLWRSLKAQPPFCIGRPRCNLNRFFSPTQRAREEVKHWPAALMNYEFLAVEESMLGKPLAKLELRPQAKENDQSKESTAATRAAPAAELSLKASCHNAVLVAITMLGDPDHLVHTNISWEFGAVVKHWYR